MPDDVTILQEQIAYYQARAQEYDQWFYREGRYDRGEAQNRQWFDEAAEVRRILQQTPPVQYALELAPGTGIWTQELVKLADHVTAVDASSEMLKINQAKVQSPKVTYVEADLFEWEPDQTYDLVFFSFWLSHVPPERLASFLQKIARALKPGGQVFMLDSRRIETSTAHDHVLPESGTVLERRLNDGRRFSIVKVFYEPEALKNAFAQAGIGVDVSVTEQFFIYAQGQRKA